MKINQAVYSLSAVKPNQYPAGGLPEIALAGRSNVGKSSLINKLVNRRGMARTSSTPGKTRTLNFYLINNSFYLVDLPGYGYARVSRQERESWRLGLEKYLSSRRELVGVILVLDLRHQAQNSDRQMLEWLLRFAKPVLPVVTKADKLSKSRQIQNLNVLAKELSLPVKPVVFSAETGQGRDELLEALEELLAGSVQGLGTELGQQDSGQHQQAAGDDPGTQGIS